MYIDTASANTRSTRPQITISSRHSSQYNDPSTPLLETFAGQDAPPSYLEATTPGLYTSRLSGEEGARLLSLDGREARHAEFKEDKYRRRSLREQCLKSKWLKGVALGLTVVILSAIFAAVILTMTAPKERQMGINAPPASAQSAGAKASRPPTLAQPSSAQDSDHPEGFISDGSDESDAPSISPARPPPPAQSKKVFPIRWPSRCGKDYDVKTEEYDFGKPSEFSIQEAVHQLDGPYKQVSGWIHVTPAPADQAPGTVQAKLSYAVSPTINTDSVKHASSAAGLVIGDPSFPDGFDGVHPGTACLGISIVIYIASGVSLSTFNVASTHLGMQIHAGVDFSVTDATSISLTTGTLDSAAFHSRETRLKTISGSISGKYLVYDLLSVKTKSGSVNINVEPKQRAQGGSEAAVFMVDALSGSIRTDFERTNIPERDYQTYINTTVGSIDGTFIHGSRTEIHSIAGFVTADILPFKSGAFKSDIRTQTHSGQTSVTLRAPYNAAGVPITGLTSSHKSTSGGLEVVYPEEWMGVVDGTSLSGALHLQGKELELVEESDEPGKNHVAAKKGAGGGRMSFDTVSGGCEITVGKV